MNFVITGKLFHILYLNYIRYSALPIKNCHHGAPITRTNRGLQEKQIWPQPIYINGDWFLGLHLDDDLTWKTNTTALIKKSQQHLYFLRVLKNKGLAKELLVSFYRCSAESVLGYCILVWFASCPAQKNTAVQRVINSAQKTIGLCSPLLGGPVQLPLPQKILQHPQGHFPPSTSTLSTATLR